MGQGGYGYSGHYKQGESVSSGYFGLFFKTAVTVADAFFQLIICRFGMPAVIYSDQGREFENNLMQELCLLLGAHKTRTTPYHPAGDGLVDRFNRTLHILLAMFAGEHRDDWGDLYTGHNDGILV